MKHRSPRINSNPILQFRNDIQSMSSAKELLEYISNSFIEQLIYVILIVLIILPILILLSQPLFSDEDIFAAISTLRLKIVIWNTVLQIICLLLLFLAFILLSKTIVAMKRYGLTKTALIIKLKLHVLLLGVLIWAMISTAFSTDFFLSLKGNIFRRDGLIIYFVYFSIFAGSYMIKDKKKIHRLVMLFVSTASFLSVLALIDLTIINQTFKINGTNSIFANRNHFGYYLCMAVLANLILINQSSNRIVRTVWFITLAILSAMLAKNESFGPMLATLTALVFSLILTIIWNKKRISLHILSVVIVICAIIVINLSTGSLINDIFRLTVDIKAIAVASEEAGNAGSSRWKLWEYGIQFIKERPFFGYGLDTLDIQYARFDIRMGLPHNEFIQYAASMGLPAMLLYLFALTIHVHDFLLLKQQHNAYSIGLICVVVAYLISSLFGCLLFYTGPYFFLFLGLSARSLKQRQKLNVN